MPSNINPTIGEKHEPTVLIKHYLSTVVKHSNQKAQFGFPRLFPINNIINRACPMPGVTYTVAMPGHVEL